MRGFVQAASVLSDNVWAIKGYRQRITTKQLKAIRLAEDPGAWFYNGIGYTLKSSYVGVGVHEVWLEPRS